MATEIDKRVVEMQFDNKDFEKNCQASLTTLEKLKMALNFDGAKGLDSMAKAASKIDLSNVSKGAEAVEVKFNAMNVAGMTAISELTKGFLNLGKTIWNVSFGQMKSGGMARTLKIEQANFQMKALAKNIKSVKGDTEAQIALVERMVKAAGDAVDGTAYGMDSAAAVASQLMASGVTESEKMLGYLKGVAGAAAMTGRSFDDIGNIFTTVASNGRLMTMQLRQFSAAGLNLSATLGQSLGKTEEEINEMVRKGEISFEQFSKALSDAFGESAKEADNTFSGVTSNVKAQLSRIGQIFTDPFVKHMVPFLKEVKAAIKRLNTVLQPFGKTWDVVFGYITKNATKNLKDLEIGRLENIMYGLENIFVSLYMIIDQVRKAFIELFPKKTLGEINQAAEDFELFTRQLIPSKETLEGLKQILVLIMSPLKLVFNILVSIWKNAVKPLSLSMVKLLGSILRLGNALKPFTKRIKESLGSFNLLDSVLKIISATIVIVINNVADFIGFIAELLNKLAETKVLNDFAQLLKNIADIVSTILIGSLLILFNVIKKIFEYLNIDNIKSFASSAYQAFQVVILFIEQGIMTILGILNGLAESSKIFGDVWEVIKNAVGVVKDLFSGEDYNQRIKNINKSLEDLGAQLKILGGRFVEFVKGIDYGKVLLIAFALGIIFLVWSLKEFTDESTKLVKNVSGLASTFAGFKKALATVANYNGVFQILLGIAIALGAFASALTTISQIPAEDLKRSAIVLGIFSAAIMGFAVAMVLLQKSMKDTDTKTGLNILMYVAGIAAAMLFLSLAVKTISTVELNLEKAITPFLVVIGLMGGLVAATIIMSRYAKEMKVGALALIGFAASVKILVSAFEQMSKIDMNKIENTLASFLSLIITFGAATGLATLGGMTFGAGFGFIGAALSILILVGILKKLSSYDYNEMLDSLKKLALLFTPVIAFIIAAGVAQRISGRSNFLKRVADTIASITFTVISMTIMVEALGRMDSEDLKKGLAAAITLGGLMTIMIRKVLDPFNDPKMSSPGKIMMTSKTVNSIAVLLGSLAVMMGIMATITVTLGNEQAYAGLLPTIMLVSLIFGGISMVLTAISRDAEKLQHAKVGPILAVVLGVIAILSAVTLLSVFMDPETMVKFTYISVIVMGFMVALGFVLDGFSKLTKDHIDAIAPTKQKMTTVQVLGVCGSIIAIMGAVGGLVYAWAKSGMTINKLMEMWPLFAGIGVLLIAAGAFIKTANKITDAWRFVGVAKVIQNILLSIAAIVATLGIAVIGIAYMSKDVPMENIAWIMVGLTAAFGIIMWAASKMMENAEEITGAEIAKASLSFFSAAGAFGLMAIALTSMIHAVKGIKSDKIKTVAWVIGVPFVALLAAMTTMIGFAQNINYEVFAKEVSSIGLALLAGAGAFAAIAFCIAVMANTAKDITTYDLETITVMIIGSLLAFGSLLVAISAFVVLGNTFNLEYSKIITIAAALVIASTSFVIIAGAISVLAVAMDLTGSPDGLRTAILGVIGIAFVLMAGMAGILAITKDSGRFAYKKYFLIAGAIAAAASSIYIIVGAIALLADIINFENREDIILGMTFVLATVGMLGIFMSVMMALASSGNVNAWTIAAMAASFVIAASSLIVIVGAMKMLSDIFTTISPTNLAILTALLIGLVAVFGALALLGGVLGQFAMPAVKGIVALAGGFAIFSAAVFLFAAAGKLFVDTIEQMNNANFDAEDIANNATQAVKGIAQAIYNCKDEIFTAVGIIILGIVAIIGAQQIKMALQAVAFVTAFLIGLDACMPLILPAIDSIMDRIIEYNSTGENAKKWEDFGKSLGDLVVHGLLGAFKGIAQSIASAIVDAWNEVKDKEIVAGVTVGDVLSFVVPSVITGNPLSGAIVTSARHQYDGYNKKGREENNEAEEEAISELKKLSGPDFLSKAMGVEDTRSEVEKWADVIDYINDVLSDAKRAGYELSSNWDDAIKDLEIPEEYMQYITDEYDHDKQRLLNALKISSGEAAEVVVELEEMYGSVSTEQTYGTLTRGAEEAAEAVGEIGESAEESSEKIEKSNDIVGNMVSNIKESMSGKTGEEIGQNIISGITEVFGDGGFLGSAFGGINIGDYKDELSKIGINVGSIAGDAAGDAVAKEINNDAMTTIKYWTDYAAQTEGNLNQPKWMSWKDEEGNSFKDLQTAAEYRRAKYVKDTYNQDVSVGHKSFLDYIGETIGLTDATKDLESALDGAGDSMLDLGEDSEKTKSKFEEFSDNLKDSIKNSLNIFNEVVEDEIISPEEMLDRMWENTRRVGQWARQISELAARGMSEGLLNELKDLGPAGAAKVDAFARMTQEQLREANLLYADAAAMPDYASKEIIQSYKDVGYDASLGFVEGIDTEIAKIKMEEMGEEGLDGLKTSLDSHSPSRETMKIGEYATEGFTIGMTNAKSQSLITKATKIIANLLMNNLRNSMNSNNLKTVGEQCMDGLVYGFNSKLPSVISRITAIATQILARFAGAFKIHSPSKVFEEFGEMTMLGFSNGMDEGQSDVVSTTDRTANDILDAMKANIASVTDGWSEDNVYSPVIRPVFDMDAIGQGYTDIQTWFANAQGINLNGNLSRLTTTNRDETDTNQQLIDAIRSIDNKDVVDELVALRNDISDLQSAMTNLQVVMNTGALVGQILEPIDVALGAKAIRNQRGR